MQNPLSQEKSKVDLLMDTQLVFSAAFEAGNKLHFQWTKFSCISMDKKYLLLPIFQNTQSCKIVQSETMKGRPLKNHKVQKSILEKTLKRLTIICFPISKHQKFS